MRSPWSAWSILLGVVASGIALAADGSLDPTFGVQGKVVTPGAPFGRSIAVQGDGRIIVAGEVIQSGISQLAMTRYESDGSLDGSFGVGGTVTSPSAESAASAVLLQPDGKIVLVGSVAAGFDSDLLLARYDTNGALDPSFGTNGIATLAGPARTWASDAVLQPDGKIVVVGGSYVPYDHDVLLMRVDDLGAPDPSFGSGGIVVTDLDTNDVGGAIALQPDGRLVVGGTSNAGGILLRYEPDGTLDATFGSGGVVAIPPAGTKLFGLVLQPTGAIVVGLVDAYDSILSRFDASGALDASFGSGGSSSVLLFTAAPLLRAQPDGALLVAGTIASSNAVVRYDADGLLDPSLGPCGVALTAFEGDAFNGTLGLGVQPDGRFLLATVLGNDPNSPDGIGYPALARFGTPGTPVCTPAPTGKSRLAVKTYYTAKWKWTGPLAPGDFGDPTLGTDYTFCIVDPASGKPSFALTVPGNLGTCFNGRCWRSRTNGFVGTRGGIVIGKLRMKLLTSAGGTRKITVSNKGSNGYVGFPPSPYPYSLPVTARMERGDGLACWEATYSNPVKNSYETGFLGFSD